MIGTTTNNLYYSYIFQINTFQPEFDINKDEKYKDEKYLTYIPPRLYCHYLYSIEELEITTCQPGFIYNPSIKECEKKVEDPVVVEEKSQMDEDNINIPDISNVLRIFLQIVIVSIILYLIYVIYDLFGEYIFAGINYVVVNYNHIRQDANFRLMDLFSGTQKSDKLAVEINKLESKIKLAEQELNHVYNKKEAAINYNNEVAYREKMSKKDEK